MANCPLTPHHHHPVCALAKLLFSVAVSPAASFFWRSSFGFVYISLTARTACLHLCSEPLQLIREETGALPCCWCFYLPLPYCSAPFLFCELRYQPPTGSSDFMNWPSATPAAFTASSSKSPHWLPCQENNCMGLPESDFALRNSFQKQIGSNLRLADDRIQSLMVMNGVPYNPCNIYSSFYFPPFLLVPFVCSSPQLWLASFSFCSLASGISFLLSKGDHTSHFWPFNTPCFRCTCLVSTCSIKKCFSSFSNSELRSQSRNYLMWTNMI